MSDFSDEPYSNLPDTDRVEDGHTKTATTSVPSVNAPRFNTSVRSDDIPMSETPFGRHDLSGTKAHFASPQDALPSMVSVMERLVELKKKHNELFEFRGAGETLLRGMETDLAAFEYVLLAEVKGDSWWAQMMIVLDGLMNKDGLIKTIQATSLFLARLNAINNDAGNLLWTERMSQFRQCTMTAWTGQESENVFASVMLKFCQVMWFTTYVYTPLDSVQKCMHYPVGDAYKDLVWLERGTELRTALMETYDENETPKPDATLPVHPSWLAHNIPFFDLPIVTQQIKTLRGTDDVEEWGLRMSFCRCLVARVEGQLRSRLEIVKELQLKLLTGILALCTFLIHQNENYAEVVLEKMISVFSNNTTNNTTNNTSMPRNGVMPQMRFL